MWGRASAVVLAMVLLVSCGGSDDRPETVTVEITQGSRTITIHAEVAATPAAREHGLMDRLSLKADAGMLFLFPKRVNTGFWMKNTLIPLDIAFIVDDAVAVIASMVPCRVRDCPLTAPGIFYEAALEVNPGSLAGITPGAHVAVTGTLPKIF